ncbi:hypothetical protein RFI_25189 [Reticulomyxa filosa]|uniref:Uncharacterized protein n=1 Tax=Reticulomyxa filosa TaxID=46433 RepID=X6MES6_RETFI|nr:hypothetical protein RFI_25189 [Reticulomyxa filosa]|eukprot:ETO12186.1 hypothetical protein RFI_25189 [Reticulomyxa filosa]
MLNYTVEFYFYFLYGNMTRFATEKVAQFRSINKENIDYYKKIRSRNIQFLEMPFFLKLTFKILKIYNKLRFDLYLKAHKKSITFVNKVYPLKRKTKRVKYWFCVICNNKTKMIHCQDIDMKLEHLENIQIEVIFIFCWNDGEKTKVRAARKEVEKLFESFGRSSNSSDKRQETSESTPKEGLDYVEVIDTMSKHYKQTKKHMDKIKLLLTTNVISNRQSVSSSATLWKAPKPLQFVHSFFPKFEIIIKKINLLSNKDLQNYSIELNALNQNLFLECKYKITTKASQITQLKYSIGKKNCKEFTVIVHLNNLFDLIKNINKKKHNDSNHKNLSLIKSIFAFGREEEECQEIENTESKTEIQTQMGKDSEESGKKVKAEMKDQNLERADLELESESEMHIEKKVNKLSNKSRVFDKLNQHFETFVEQLNASHAEFMETDNIDFIQNWCIKWCYNDTIAKKGVHRTLLSIHAISCLLWSYHDLFEIKCFECDQILQFEGMLFGSLPPIIRVLHHHPPFIRPFHSICTTT